MKAPPFNYHAPRSVGDALGLLAAQPNARLLAGGQSLMPILNFRLAAPDHLIDLNRIAELAYLRASGDGSAIEIGAMTRQRDVEFSGLVAERLPLLAEAITWVGHRQTRNRGTVGGSLCHLDPSAEIPLVAAMHDATLRIASARGERTLAMSDFAREIMTTALEADELLVELRLPIWPAGHGAGFVEFARRHGDFAIVSAAALVQKDAVGRIARIALGLGGVAPTPQRLRATEAALVGAAADDEAIARAADAAGAIDAMGDATYPAWYRRKVAAAMMRRALTRAFANSGGKR